MSGPADPAVRRPVDRAVRRPVTRPVQRRDAERRAWSALRGLVLDNDRRRLVAEELGMSYQRAKALRFVARSPMALHQLAAELVTDQPYTTVMVRDLAARGLVTTEPNPRDGRSKLVRATPAGEQLGRRAGELMNAPPPGFATLSDADLAALERIVARVGGNLEAG